MPSDLTTITELEAQVKALELRELELAKACRRMVEELESQVYSGVLKDAELSTRVYFAQVAAVGRAVL